MVYEAFDASIACMPLPAYMSPEVLPCSKFTIILNEILLIFLKSTNFANVLMEFYPGWNSLNFEVLQAYVWKNHFLKKST